MQLAGDVGDLDGLAGDLVDVTQLVGQGVEVLDVAGQAVEVLDGLAGQGVSTEGRSLPAATPPCYTAAPAVRCLGTDRSYDGGLRDTLAGLFGRPSRR